MRKITLRILLITIFFNVSTVMASCRIATDGYQIKTFDFGNVIVQRDTPVGTVLATANTGSWSSGAALFGCTTTWVYQWELSMFTNPSAINGVYNTNINGIGIRITNVRALKTFPYTQNMPANTFAVLTDVKAELVKTIPNGTEGGSISLGTLAKALITGEMYTEEVDMGVNKIIPVACSILTPSLTFPIGDILLSDFGSTVGTIPLGAQNTQNLGLSCEDGANINVELSATPNPDVADKSVLALTGQGQSGIATGVGVQLLYNGSPLKINNRLILNRSNGGQELFPITARYYQTRSSVTTGIANASATLNLTYQ